MPASFEPDDCNDTTGIVMRFARLKLWRSLTSTRPQAAAANIADASVDATAFDERWYLMTYPDIAAAVEKGQFASGREHYLLSGRDEGRKGARSILERDPEDGLSHIKRRHQAELYLSPEDLSDPDFRLRRTLVIGICLAEAWTNHLDVQAEHRPEFLLVNRHSVMPSELPHPASDYDVFVAQLPLRDLLPDDRFWRLAYHDVEGHRRAFQEACLGIDIYVEKICAWAEAFGVPVLFGNLLLPQADLTGRLLPRYDLRNGIHFVEELNRVLERSIGRFSFAHLLDVDKVAASFGRRYVQDDSVLWAAHGSLMPINWDMPTRTEPMAPIEEHYDVTWPSSFVAAIWAEVAASVRTLRQADMVKLVVMDLDDTLWSGISGDEAEIDPLMVEGWPLGIAEALMFLKKRGILLAIISKNSEERIRDIWPSIFRGQMALEDFAAIRINWDRKSDNMAEILRAVNLLPESTVFVDDSPVERAEMRHAYPDMRVLGRYPLYLRRTLLWSSETQVATISEESANRTRTVHAKIERDSAERALDRADFLLTLEMKVATSEIGIDDPRFGRALELLNKTNQFNTTGQRWTRSELQDAFKAGLRLFVFTAEDRFTAYGLIGACLVVDTTIEQFVMSCRVNGLDVELAALSDILAAIRQLGRERVMARFVETRSNLLCRDLWKRCGFSQSEGTWLLPSETGLYRPAHISRSPASV